MIGFPPRFADRSPAAYGVAYGLLAGLLFGVITGLTDHSAWAGLFQGAFFGVGMAVVFAIKARRRWPASLSALSTDQRPRVRAAVLKGEPVDDPDLARAVIDYATRVEQAQARVWPMRLAGVAFAALTAWLAIDGFGRHDPGGGVLWLVAMCFWLLVAFALPVLGARSRARAARAKAAARALLGQA